MGKGSGHGLQLSSSARHALILKAIPPCGTQFPFLASVDGVDWKEFWFPLPCSWTLRTPSWAPVLGQARVAGAEWQTLEKSRHETQETCLNLLPLPSKEAFSGASCLECGGRAPSVGLGSELRIMWPGL